MTDSVEVHFDRFPFITGVYEFGEFSRDLKEFLPFTLTYDSELRIIVQRSSAEVDAQLATIYERGSFLSTPLGLGNLNGLLADELIGLIRDITGGIVGKNFFEPGCGTGFLLCQLKTAGARAVLGAEPGKSGDEENGIPILKDFFTASLVKEKQDCVYSYGVLEHISRLDVFLRDSISVLVDGGTVFAAVPGCDEDFEIGNVTCLAHEHYNYFTQKSLKDLFHRSGLVNVQVRSLSYSKGIIAAWGTKSKDHDSVVETSSGDEDRRVLKKFICKARESLRQMQARVAFLEERGKTLGFYGSPRALAGILDFKCAPRQFDGDQYKQGKYFNGTSSVIEPPENLLSRPVDEIWILPIHHDRAIRNFLEKHIISRQPDINVYSVRDLLENISAEQRNG